MVEQPAETVPLFFRKVYFDPIAFFSADLPVHKATMAMLIRSGVL